MANKLTIKQVAEDLQFANEIAEEFGYGFDSDGNLIGEQYAEDGSIAATYRIDITITEMSN